MADMMTTTPVQKTGVCECALVRSVSACVEATVELCWSFAESLFASLARRRTLPTRSYVIYVSNRATLLFGLHTPGARDWRNERRKTTRAEDGLKVQLCPFAT